MIERSRQRRFTARATVLVLVAVASVGFGLYALAAQPLDAPTITSKPNDPTTQTSASFTYTHKKSGVTFQCSLDGSPFAACGSTRPSTKVYPGPLPTGTHTFAVRAVSGSQTSAPTTANWTIDLTAPSVVSILRSGANPTNAGSVSWSVTFDEPVTGVGADDFSLTSAGLLLPLITSVSGSGASYTVTATTGLGSGGTLGLNLIDNDSIRDLAGNRLGGAGAGNGNFTGQVYTVDKVAPPKPTFTQVPPDPSPTAGATFAWADAEAGVAYQCSKENGPWFACSSPHSYAVAITNNQTHRFAVRAVDAAGNVSPAASYSWKISDIDFTISGEVVGLLYPGTWRSIAVSITNPNSYAIEITSLTASVTSSPAGCPASSNIEFQQSPISESHRVTIPRNSTVTLAPADRPLIRLRDLPSNQDACKLGTFDLFYAGTGTK